MIRFIGSVGLLFMLLIATACRLGLASNSPVPTPQPQSFVPGLSSANEGLADLRRYRAKVIVEFEGIRNGQPTSGRLESLTELSRQPRALHQYLKVDTVLTSTGLISGVSEFYQVADQVYVKKEADGKWLTFSGSLVSPADLGFFALDRLIILPTVVSQPPQPDLLADQPVLRYTFTERDLAAPNIVFEQAEGNLWLAQPGGYLAQYVISATLRVVIPDPKAHLFDQGHLSLRYTLSDANADFFIIPPRQAIAAPAPLSHLPRLPDAQIISIFPTFIEYTSAITPIQAALFYREQLTDQGWTENQAEIFNEKARLTYAREGESLTILINPVDESQKINVLLELK